jgi:hypothetical protein
MNRHSHQRAIVTQLEGQMSIRTRTFGAIIAGLLIALGLALAGVLAGSPVKRPRTLLRA